MAYALAPEWNCLLDFSRHNEDAKLHRFTKQLRGRQSCDVPARSPMACSPQNAGRPSHLSCEETSGCDLTYGDDTCAVGTPLPSRLASGTGDASLPCQRHVLLCYKEPKDWPANCNSFDWGTMPRNLRNAMVARERDVKKKCALTVCEGRDGAGSYNGDVLVFPDMLIYRALTRFDVEYFVTEALIKERAQYLEPEPLTGCHVFVCCHDTRGSLCGKIGPRVADEFTAHLARRGLQGLVRVWRCCHLEADGNSGTPRCVGNVAVYMQDAGAPSVKMEGAAAAGAAAGLVEGGDAAGKGLVPRSRGDWYSRVTPSDVGAILDTHILGGKLVDRLWLGRLDGCKDSASFGLSATLNIQLPPLPMPAAGVSALGAVGLGQQQHPQRKLTGGLMQQQAPHGLARHNDSLQQRTYDEKHVKSCCSDGCLASAVSTIGLAGTTSSPLSSLASSFDITGVPQNQQQGQQSWMQSASSRNSSGSGLAHKGSTTGLGSRSSNINGQVESRSCPEREGRPGPMGQTEGVGHYPLEAFSRWLDCASAPAAAASATWTLVAGSAGPSATSSSCQQTSATFVFTDNVGLCRDKVATDPGSMPSSQPTSKSRSTDRSSWKAFGHGHGTLTWVVGGGLAAAAVIVAVTMWARSGPPGEDSCSSKQ